MKSIFSYSLIIFFLILSPLVKAQDPNERGNLTNYYGEKLHFGFTLGVNRANFIIHYAEHFERFDSLKTVQSTPKLGFNLGIVSELRLQKYITLRFIPNLSFAERNIQYYFEGHDTIVRTKTIESTFLNFPLNLKLRSKRVNNFGAYVIAGGGYSLDLASKRKTVNTSTNINEQIVKLKRDDFSYEVGAGAEFYLEYFKLAIEGKLTIGTTNLLIKDDTIYSNSIDKLNSKVFLISLTFEG
ncbi:MAG: PorT family protein [Bacteroidota bacterium]|nr:PorT family protein [Bacteroidota bacterium]